MRIAVKAARAVRYVGAGTIEFIADASQGLHADRIWFMEMNTRLQVEHPVTEAITGQDLVEWQLRVAGGEPLPLRQDALHINGSAMEARLYAENPTTGFLPSTGPLRHLRLPGGIRVDSGVEEGGEVTGYYDPMIAKLIVHAPNREAAARRLAEACASVEVWPVHTNAAFLARVAADEAFAAGEIDTGFIERKAGTLIPSSEPSEEVVQAAAHAVVTPSTAEPWAALVGFRANAPSYGRVTVEMAVGTTRLPEIRLCRLPPYRSWMGKRILFHRGEAWSFGLPKSALVAGTASVSDGALRSPMPGRIVSVSVEIGQRVTQGQALLALEAMKMEHALVAPFDGSVVALQAAVGDQVAENVILVRIAGEE